MKRLNEIIQETAEIKEIVREMEKTKIIEESKKLIDRLWKLMDDVDLIEGTELKRYEINKLICRIEEVIRKVEKPKKVREKKGGHTQMNGYVYRIPVRKHPALAYNNWRSKLGNELGKEF